MPQNHVRFQPTPTFMSVGPILDIGVNEGLAQGMPLGDFSPSPDWTYSTTAENLVEEVAVLGVDMDDEPGLIYSGKVGAAISLQLTDFDLSAGEDVAETTDFYNVGIFVNNDLIIISDEGWVEGDAASTEFNLNGLVPNLQTNDVLRVAVISQEGAEDDITVNAVGKFSLLTLA